MKNIEVLVCRTDDGKNLDLPEYKTPESAGMDLHASIKEDVIIEPFDSVIIPTGIKVQLPVGFEMQVRPRSGLAAKSKVTVLNTPGTVESDYRGEVGVILINFGKEPFVVKRGDRIAQIVFNEVARATLKEVDETELTTTARGEGGFGHTGIRG